MRTLILGTAGAAVLLAWTAFAASRDFWQGDTADRSTVPVRPVLTLIPTGPVVRVGTACPLPPAGGPIPVGFTPVRAFRCVGEQIRNDPTLLETRDPVTVSRLTKAYTTALIAEQSDGCTLQLDFDPAVALVDAHGAAIMPAPPRDSCGHVIPAVLEVLDGWTAPTGP